MSSEIDLRSEVASSTFAMLLDNVLRPYLSVREEPSRVPILLQDAVTSLSSFDTLPLENLLGCSDFLKGRVQNDSFESQKWTLSIVRLLVRMDDTFNGQDRDAWIHVSRRLLIQLLCWSHPVQQSNILHALLVTGSSRIGMRLQDNEDSEEFLNAITKAAENILQKNDADAVLIGSLLVTQVSVFAAHKHGNFLRKEVINLAYAIFHFSPEHNEPDYRGRRPSPAYVERKRRKDLGTMLTPLLQISFAGPATVRLVNMLMVLCAPHAIPRFARSRTVLRLVPGYLLRPLKLLLYFPEPIPKIESGFMHRFDEDYDRYNY